MNIIIQIVVLLITAYLSFTFGTKYIYDKIKVNKWVVLILSGIFFIIQVVFAQTLNPIISIVLLMLVIFLFMWYLHVNMTGGPKQNGKKGKEIVIKPKAKPNRAKHLNNEKKD